MCNVGIQSLILKIVNLLFSFYGIILPLRVLFPLSFFHFQILSAKRFRLRIREKLQIYGLYRYTDDIILVYPTTGFVSWSKMKLVAFLSCSNADG